MQPVLIYCYDAYCGWCYGFSPVMKQIADAFKEKLTVEVLSGGMMIRESVAPVQKIAPFIQSAYKRVEEYTGVQFGKDFLWHIENPQQSDWIMNSEKPAIALCIFKEYHPEKQLDFASDMQYALNYEGRDLDDSEAYRHLLDKYKIGAEEFYQKLMADEYREMAYHEFALCRQLQVNAFPAVLLQTSGTKFHLIAKGYTPYEDLSRRIDAILRESVL